MQEWMIETFGTYAPIEGSPDWGYIASVAIYIVFLYGVLRIVGGLLKKNG